MAKIQLVAVTSLDGCLSDFQSEGCFWINPYDYGIMDISKKASRILTPNDTISKLVQEHKKADDETYLVIADTDNAGFVNALMKKNLIDEIVLYSMPFIAGTGKYLFHGQAPISYWTWTERKDYGEGIFCNFYSRLDIREVQRRRKELRKQWREEAKTSGQ